MEIYLLFLMGAFVLGVFKPKVRLSVMALVIVAMAFMVSVGYFVFRLV
jgi:hypothetical protein